VTVHCRIPGSLVGRISAEEATIRPHRGIESAASFPDLATG
jgi:hypothetical protein